jgi:hypothetical protein
MMFKIANEQPSAATVFFVHAIAFNTRHTGCVTCMLTDELQVFLRVPFVHLCHQRTWRQSKRSIRARHSNVQTKAGSKVCVVVCVYLFDHSRTFCFFRGQEEDNQLAFDEEQEEDQEQDQQDKVDESHMPEVYKLLDSKRKVVLSFDAIYSLTHPAPQIDCQLHQIALPLAVKKWIANHKPTFSKAEAGITPHRLYVCTHPLMRPQTRSFV